MDKFGRTPEQVKADQRRILEKALQAYPEWVDSRRVPAGSAERLDLHDLIDHGLLDREGDPRGVVGDETFVPLYRLSAHGMDMLRIPHWLDRNYPTVVNVNAVGSSVNVGSPGAAATTHANINILVRLREEVDRSNASPEEKSKLRHALEVLLTSPVIGGLARQVLWWRVTQAARPSERLICG